VRPRFRSLRHVTCRRCAGAPRFGRWWADPGQYAGGCPCFWGRLTAEKAPKKVHPFLLALLGCRAGAGARRTDPTGGNVVCGGAPSLGPGLYWLASGRPETDCNGLAKRSPARSGTSRLSYRRAPDRPDFTPWNFRAGESMVLPSFGDGQPISDQTTFDREDTACRANARR